MLTGPQSMDTFSDGNIPPEDKKAVIAYLEKLDEQPSYSGFTLGGLGPVSEGIIAWLGRHRRPRRLRRLDRGPHHPLEQEEGRGGSVSDAHNNDEHGGELATVGPIANPGLPEHQWRPTDVDPAKEKRAERQVAAPVRPLGASASILFLVAYFTLDIGDNWHVVGGFGASTMALGRDARLRAAADRRRHHPLGPQAHG